MDKRIKLALSELGLTETEAEVYCYLVEFGKSPATRVAKKIKIPRTTIYSAINRLTEKGLVHQEKKSSSTNFIANDVSSLEDFFATRQSILQRKEQIAKELGGVLQPFFTASLSTVPKMSYYEGEANLDNMFIKNYSLWQQSLAKYDYTWWGFQDHTYVEKYYKSLQWHWDHLHQKEKVRLFSNDVAVERKLAKKNLPREIRSLPVKSKFTSTIWVAGEFVILLKTRDSPHYAIQLQDQEFAANFREVFKMLWEMTEFT